MKHIIYYCDLCLSSTVDPRDNGMSFIMNSGSHQKWPNNDNDDFLICEKCCNLLARAEKMKLIMEIDTEPLFINSGWEKNKDGNWTKGSAIFGKVTVFQ